jgi:hypothetical protein
MSGTSHGPTPRAKATSDARSGPSLRSTLFGAACDAAMDAEVDAAIEAALAKYEGDPEEPMIGFRDSMDAIPDEDDCAICRAVNAAYEPPELVPLPDGTVLELRRRRTN